VTDSLPTHSPPARTASAWSSPPPPATGASRMSQKILVVEDEPDLLDLVVYNLKKEGFKPLRAETGEKALEIARGERPDLVLLDLMMPGLDGLEVCRRLRSNEATADIPIVMMTARAEEADAVVGLAMGADDYVKKPFGVKELVARVRAVLRRTGATADPGQKVVRVGDLEVDPAKHEVRLRGQDVVCTPTELRLLHHLVRNRGRVFTRAQLLDKAVGTDVVVIDRNIDVHVATLRKKLDDYGTRIVTIRGVGYKFADR
jgi:two-component system alkaline phosphatase synthesis response regulator PhoP